MRSKTVPSISLLVDSVRYKSMLKLRSLDWTVLLFFPTDSTGYIEIVGRTLRDEAGQTSDHAIPVPRVILSFGRHAAVQGPSRYSMSD
jgi:hypothetical protein